MRRAPAESAISAQQARSVPLVRLKTRMCLMLRMHPAVGNFEQKDGAFQRDVLFRIRKTRITNTAAAKTPETPLINGTMFNIFTLAAPTCSSTGGAITCTFHRQVAMRAMN